MKVRMEAFATDRCIGPLICGSHMESVSLAGISHLTLNLVERMWLPGKDPDQALVPNLKDLMPGGSLSPLPWMGQRGRPESIEMKEMRRRKGSVRDWWTQTHGGYPQEIEEIENRYRLLMKYRKDLLLEGKRTAEEVREALAKAGLADTPPA